MELTGKCKEDFEKWCLDRDNDIVNMYDYHRCKESKLLMFYDGYWCKLPFSMQYGVYVDFFDSVGLSNADWSLGLYIRHYEFVLIDLDKKSPKEARTEGIKKANEIYNDNTRQT